MAQESHIVPASGTDAHSGWNPAFPSQIPAISSLREYLTNAYHTGMEGIRSIRRLVGHWVVDELAKRIEAVELCHRQAGEVERAASVATGLPGPVDVLPRGVLHEWLCADDGDGDGKRDGAGYDLNDGVGHGKRERGCDGNSERVRKSASDGSPPVSLFVHLAAHACGSDAGLIVWIGRSLWPTPHALMRAGAHVGRNLLRDSLLLDPSTLADRLWAIDLCARSPATSVVIADASGMQLAHSRRLQLAAEAGGALALLARPHREHTTLSAAAMRWRVACVPSPTTRPRWRVELVRCKGVQRCHDMEAKKSLVLERHRATGCMRVPGDVADRSVETQTAAESASARRAG